MTLHAGGGDHVGVRELHDRLSEYLDRVERGADVVVTRRGRPVAVISAVDRHEGLQDLVRRGVITAPAKPGRTNRARVVTQGSVSDLVSDQRR
jgi:prevent-host-death family protein